MEEPMSQETMERPTESESFRVQSRGGRGFPPRGRSPGGMGGPGWGRRIIAMALALVIGYLLYIWEVKRVVVDQGNVLVLLKKNGSRSLKGDQIIVPREPKAGTSEHDAWEKEYGD